MSGTPGSGARTYGERGRGGMHRGVWPRGPARSSRLRTDPPLRTSRRAVNRGKATNDARGTHRRSTSPAAPQQPATHCLTHNIHRPALAAISLRRLHSLFPHISPSPNHGRYSAPGLPDYKQRLVCAAAQSLAILTPSRTPLTPSFSVLQQPWQLVKELGQGAYG